MALEAYLVVLDIEGGARPLPCPGCAPIIPRCQHACLRTPMVSNPFRCSCQVLRSQPSCFAPGRDLLPRWGCAAPPIFVDSSEGPPLASRLAIVVCPPPTLAPRSRRYLRCHLHWDRDERWAKRRAKKNAATLACPVDPSASTPATAPRCPSVTCWWSRCRCRPGWQLGQDPSWQRVDTRGFCRYTSSNTGSCGPRLNQRGL